MKQHVIQKLYCASLCCVTLHYTMLGWLRCAMSCYAVLCYGVLCKSLRATQQGLVNVHLGDRL